MTKFFPTPANFNGLLYQSQDFIRTLNIFSILFELPTIDSAQKFNFKALFYFQKTLRGGPLTKIFCNSCKLEQATVPKSGLHSNFKYFPILFEVPIIDSAQKFQFYHIFYFLKSVKGGPLTKIFCNSCKL